MGLAVPASPRGRGHEGLGQTRALLHRSLAVVFGLAPAATDKPINVAPEPGPDRCEKGEFRSAVLKLVHYAGPAQYTTATLPITPSLAVACHEVDRRCSFC